MLYEVAGAGLEFLDLEDLRPHYPPTLIRSVRRLEANREAAIAAAGTSHLLVQRAVRATGHCGFDSSVEVPAFDALVAWIEHGTVPEGDDVLGDVSRLGLRWTLVFDPRDPAAPRH